MGMCKAPEAPQTTLSRALNSCCSYRVRLESQGYQGAGATHICTHQQQHPAKAQTWQQELGLDPTPSPGWATSWTQVQLYQPFKLCWGAAGAWPEHLPVQLTHSSALAPGAAAGSQKRKFHSKKNFKLFPSLKLSESVAGFFQSSTAPCHGAHSSHESRDTQAPVLAHAHPFHSLLTHPPMKKDQLLLPLRLSLLGVRDVDVSLFQLQVSEIHPSLTHMLSAILNEWER